MLQSIFPDRSLRVFELHRSYDSTCSTSGEPSSHFSSRLYQTYGQNVSVLRGMKHDFWSLVTNPGDWHRLLLLQVLNILTNACGRFAALHFAAADRVYKVKMGLSPRFSQRCRITIFHDWRCSAAMHRITMKTETTAGPGFSGRVELCHRSADLSLRRTVAA